MAARRAITARATSCCLGRRPLRHRLVGFLVRRNVLVMLMSIELMLNAVNLTSSPSRARIDDAHGQAFAFFVIAVAAAEAAVGLAIVLALLPHPAARVNVDESDDS